MRQPLGDIGLIGDRRTIAALGRDATVCWYSPHRFDRPSVFAELLDEGKGAWRVSLPSAIPAGRRYLEESAILETRLAAARGELVVADWMTLGAGARPGLLCRQFSRAPAAATISLDAWTGYGRCRAEAALAGQAAVFEDGLHVFASHPLRLDAQGVHWTLPQGEEGWTVLADGPCDPPCGEDIAAWRRSTLTRWRDLAGTTSYDGPNRAAVAASLRQLRLLVFEPTGAIAAAATLGLPEVLGGSRNYDYRYAWLRDAAMVVRALLRTAGGSREGDAFLDFIHRSRAAASRPPLNVVLTADGLPVPQESNPPLAGYAGSKPVRVGNRAGSQLQLGSLGNFLLAAAMIYREREARQRWSSVEAVADFLAARWHEPDSGIWEAPRRRQYTVSKVLAACGLEAVAPFAGARQALRYRQAAQAIRDFVYRHCLTRDGAFAAFAGCPGVDISAALFPLWSFCRPDAPEMAATMAVLHRDYERDGLFAREDETPESAREGAFLAGTFWVAQYWTACGDRKRAQRYIDAGLAHANDLGMLPEEVDWRTGAALGNLPLGMAHASFLNAVADLAAGG